MIGGSGGSVSTWGNNVFVPVMGLNIGLISVHQGWIFMFSCFRIFDESHSSLHCICGKKTLF